MRTTILIMFLFVILYTGFCWRSYKFRLINVHGECFDNLCNTTLTMNKSSSFAMGFDFITDHEFDPVYFNFVTFVINVDKTEKVFFNKTIDMCAFLRNKQTDQLFAIVFNGMKTFGLAMKSCPMTGHFYYNDFELDAEKFPPYMPGMKMRTDCKVTGGFKNDKGKLFVIAKYSMTVFVDNSAGVNRLIKINGK